MKNKKFIKDLLPPYPIIVNLLPKEARDVVGKVHPNTEPAKGILEQEGFSFNGQVGIFEPGPIISATVENIRTVRDACHSLIKEISSEDFKSELNIISTIGTYNFRACLGHVENLGDGFVRISENSAKALQLKIGDEICFVSLRA
jgi:arginine N-succinyltransferase